MWLWVDLLMTAAIFYCSGDLEEKKGADNWKERENSIIKQKVSEYYEKLGR
jgi:hypothetical protein